MKKKISREERAEYKGGKYMGGPAEEKAEMKKKKMKRMMDGGMAGIGRAGGMMPSVGPMYNPAPMRGDMMPARAPRFPVGRVPGGMMTRPAISKSPYGIMRGGGLARKGIGQALAKGGMVSACGVAQRGKTRGKMV